MVLNFVCEIVLIKFVINFVILGLMVGLMIIIFFGGVVWYLGILNFSFGGISFVFLFLVMFFGGMIFICLKLRFFILIGYNLFMGFNLCGLIKVILV